MHVIIISSISIYSQLETLQEDHEDQLQAEEKRLKTQFGAKKSDLEKGFAKQLEKYKEEIEIKVMKLRHF